MAPELAPAALRKDAPGLHRLLARAELYRLLARALSYPGEPGSPATGAAFLEQLRAAARDASPPGEDCAALTDALAGLERAVGEAPAEPHHLAQEYLYCFSRAVPVPANEASYDGLRTFGGTALRADVAGFYAAFGFKAGPRELPDHVTSELEFLALLYAKEVYARARGWTRRAALTRAARDRFVAEHPARWLPAFRARLEASARVGFYPAVAALAEAALRQEPGFAAAVPVAAVEPLPCGPACLEATGCGAAGCGPAGFAPPGGAEAGSEETGGCG